MEYQKVANLLDNASDQPSKLRTRNWVKRNDKQRWRYSGNNIKFKTTMLGSNSCDYADAYILVKEGTVTITGAGDADDKKKMPQDKQMKEIKASYLKIVHRLLNA